MKVSVLPQPLPKECEKAARIFQSFVDRGNNGLDGVIPRHVLEHAKGFAIFTIVKAGFVFSARAGSGVVIARLADGRWSAPSAIGTAGLGFGGQAGAEVTDFLIVLNSTAAVRSFMAAGSLTLGGNMSVALGPLGRNGEASGSLNTSGKVAAMYSYSKTRGLFGGLSVEGSVIIERQDANALAYQMDVTAKMILSGAIDPPEWALPLIKTLGACTGMPGGQKWVEESGGGADMGYAFGSGLGSPGSAPVPKKKQQRRTMSGQFPPNSWGRPKNTGSYFSPHDETDFSSTQRTATSTFETKFDSNFNPFAVPPSTDNKNPFPTNDLTKPNNSPFKDLSPFPSPNPLQTGNVTNTHKRSNTYSYSPTSGNNPFDSLIANNTSSNAPIKPRLTTKRELTTPLDPMEGIGRAIALYDFNAVEAGDLSFKKGQVITIVRKTEKTEDWWTGKVDGREGIFPANFVEIV